MKKLIFIIILAALALPSVAQLKFYPKAAFDWYASNKLAIDNYSADIWNYRVRTGWELAWKKVSVYADQDIYMNRTPSKATFSPGLVIWKTGVQFTHNKIKLQFEHACYHPIFTGGGTYPAFINGGYNRFSLSYGY